MEIHEDTPGQISIEFPLGLALLVSLLFFICCFFCCCLHWDKLQSFFPSSWIINNDINPHVHSHIQPDFNFTSSHHKPGFPVLVITVIKIKKSLYIFVRKLMGFFCCVQMMKQNHVQSLPVLMPGDELPKFIAMECPCKPPNDEKITIHVQKTAPPEHLTVSVSNFC